MPPSPPPSQRANSQERLRFFSSPDCFSRCVRSTTRRPFRTESESAPPGLSQQGGKARPPPFSPHYYCATLKAHRQGGRKERKGVCMADGRCSPPPFCFWFVPFLVLSTEFWLLRSCPSLLLFLGRVGVSLGLPGKKKSPSGGKRCLFPPFPPPSSSTWGGKWGGEGRKRKDEDESEKSGLGWRRRKRPLYNVKGGRRSRAYEKRGPS